VVLLGPTAALRAACEGLEASERTQDAEPGTARLRDLLLRPLGLEAEKTKRLILSPEGPLSYVPFSALAPDTTITVVPSATTYGLYREEATRAPGGAVLAVGDPDYGLARDALAVATYERGSRLARLPGTGVEAKSVGDVVLLGAQATETGVLEALSGRERWRAVHLACHGLVDPERPTLSSLALSPGAHSDGYLTVLEVLDWKVPADLVVLSACETGTGRIVAGEGIVGLTRAFMFAGAPRVICSLWKVDDEATRALMTKFYELWNPRPGSAGVATSGDRRASKEPGLSTAEALRQAQAFVRSQEKWKHPYYWAAWVLWGLPE
jgi:CHAT domain-containing protein